MNLTDENELANSATVISMIDARITIEIRLHALKLSESCRRDAIIKLFSMLKAPYAIFKDKQRLSTCSARYVYILVE